MGAAAARAGLLALAARLLRAGRTSGAVLTTSDLLAQSIETSGFRERSSRRRRPDLWRTLRWLLVGLTLDGPYWDSGFRLVDRLFGARESWAARGEKDTRHNAPCPACRAIFAFHNTSSASSAS